MNWKLIFKLSLLLCLLSNLIILVPLLFYGNTDPPLLILLLHFIVLLFGTFIPPVLVIGKKVPSRRFLHGLLVGIIGGTIGLLVLIFPVLIVISVFIPGVPADLGQGLGIFAFFVWLFSVITSPVIGFFSWLVGKIFDKRKMIQGSAISPEAEPKEPV